MMGSRSPAHSPLSGGSASPGETRATAAAATPSSTAAAMSLVARLQRIASKGSEAVSSRTEISELQLLWSAIDSTAWMSTATASLSQTSASSSAVVDAPISEPHARFIAETTGLLWGGDYPPWVVQQWVRLSDDEEEGDCDEVVVVTESGRCASAGATHSYPAATVGCAHDETKGVHTQGARDSQACGRETSHVDPRASSCGTTTIGVEAAGTSVSENEAPAEMSSPSWTMMMQQALESLQLHLPLQEGPHTPQPHLASSAEAPMTTLANHLVQDAPMLWLRYLLVPMYTQWTQQRTVASPSAGKTTMAKGPTPPSSLSPSIATALEHDGSVTMHQLLGALGTASMREALCKEKSWSNDLVELVADGLVTSSSAAPTLETLRERRVALEDQQQQHTGELLCFTGTLAKAAQSFMVLGQGGYTLLATHIVRLLGCVRAAWAEWVSRLAEADVQRVAQSLQDSGAHETRADRAKNNGVKTEEEEEEERQQQPAEKRVRIEQPPRCSASPIGVTYTAALRSFAALRAAMSATARQQAHLVWRCWYILYGYYGADLYTNEMLARALEEEDLLKAGVRRMTATQQEHWRRLRLAADVKQHALSETHWLWCHTLLASMETTVMAELEKKSAQRNTPVKTRGSTSPVPSTDVPPACTTELLYLRLLEGTVRAFVAELRNALRVYGEAALALRSGGLQSSTLTVPSVLQTVAHNAMALQDTFSLCLVETLRQTRATAVNPPQTASCSALRTQAGVYLWQLYPTLLRVQVPEEASWMSTTGAEQAGDAVGASDTTEVAAAQFSEKFKRDCRRRGSLLSAAFSDAAHCMEQTLERCRPRTASSATPPCSDDVGQKDTWNDVNTIAGVLADIVHSSHNRAAAAASSNIPSGSGSAASGDGWEAALGDVAENFYAVYDQSCFFALRPERQRLFTRAVQRLYGLLMKPSNGHPDGSSSLQSAAAGSTTAETPPPYRSSLVRVLCRDTRLWMLLAHGVLLQLERRGRMAREDEALLACHLLPLMVLLGSQQDRGESRGGSTDPSPPSTAPEACPTWTNPATARDVLLLLVSGLVSPPWGLEELYITVQRHAALCLRHCTCHNKRVSADDTAAAVAEMASWFGAAEPPQRSAASSTKSAAVATPWDLYGASEAGSPHALRDRSAAALAKERAEIDAQCRRDDPPFPCSGDGAASASEEACLLAALDRHRRLASASLASAPCGLLMVVGAYRSCGRAFHGLRAALEEHHRMAREEEAGQFVGRTGTFCTSADISSFRGLITTVHSCVFGCTLQARGLLRLWLGYLQQLFECVVPRSASQSSGDIAGSEGEDTLVLMPSSWQRRHRITSLFGARVYRTGWRALQHAGEPSSQTRLREVLGECLADLMLLPYSNGSQDTNDGGDTTTGSSMGHEDSDGTAATQAILQRTLPHMVLEILCELLRIPAQYERATVHKSQDTAVVDAPDESIKESFLGLAGLLAFLRRLELRVVPGSLQDPRLVHLLRRVYEAADAAALDI